MDLSNQILQLKNLILQRWLSQDVFSLQWWFLFATLVFGYIVWIKLLDKRRIMEIVLFGSFIAVTNVTIDIVAVLYGLWAYNFSLFPITPSLFPFDFSIIPVMFMLAYQYFTPWKKFFWGTALVVALFSFIFLPILKYLDIVTLQKWNLIYSFILRYSEIIIARAAIGFIKRI